MFARTGNRAAAGGASIYYGNYLAALSFFLGFVSGAVHLHSRGVFLGAQIEDFGASRAQISLAFSLATAAGALFAPVLGYLLDRFPIRRVMLAGAVWMGIGFIVLAQASTLVQFSVLMALFIGLGTGTIGTTANTKLMVSWFDRRRGLALSIAITGYSVAGIVMAPVAVELLERLGWRGSYGLFSGVLLLLVLPTVALLVRDRARPEENRSNGAGPVRADRSALEAYRAFARSVPFWVCVLIFGSMSAVLGGLNLHLFLHFSDGGLSPGEAASVLSLEGVLALASKPVVGYVIDRFGAWQATIAALGGCLAALLVLLIVDSYPGALVAGALIGLAFGGVIPLQAALLSRLFGEARFARAYGSLRIAIFPLTVSSPLLIGYLHDVTGNYSAAFAVFAGLFVITLLACWRVPMSRLTASGICSSAVEANPTQKPDRRACVE